MEMRCVDSLHIFPALICLDLFLNSLTLFCCSSGRCTVHPHWIFSRAFCETIRMTFGVCVCMCVCVCVCVCVSRAYHLVLLGGF